MSMNESTSADKSTLAVRVATPEDASKLAHLIEDIEAQTTSAAFILNV